MVSRGCRVEFWTLPSCCQTCQLLLDCHCYRAGKVLFEVGHGGQGEPIPCHVKVLHLQSSQCTNTSAFWCCKTFSLSFQLVPNAPKVFTEVLASVIVLQHSWWPPRKVVPDSCPPIVQTLNWILNLKTILSWCCHFFFLSTKAGTQIFVAARGDLCPGYLLSDEELLEETCHPMFWSAVCSAMPSVGPLVYGAVGFSNAMEVTCILH